MILTKEYRLVWGDKILAYGQFDLNTQTETIHNTFECDTQAELDAKVLELGFEIPKDD